jgi:hypothetical protein
MRWRDGSQPLRPVSPQRKSVINLTLRSVNAGPRNTQGPGERPGRLVTRALGPGVSRQP